MPIHMPIIMHSNDLVSSSFSKNGSSSGSTLGDCVVLRVDVFESRRLVSSLSEHDDAECIGLPLAQRRPSMIFTS